MLQPSAIPTSVSSELTESLQQTLSASRIRARRVLGIGFSLPTDMRGFLLFLLAIIVIGAGMTAQIMLSIQIWQTTAKVADLKIEYQSIEQQNTALVWEIAQKSTLENVHQRAEALGYNVALNRYYVPAQQPAQLATVTKQSTITSLDTAVTADPAILKATSAFDFSHNLQNVAAVLAQWWQK